MTTPEDNTAELSDRQVERVAVRAVRFTDLVVRLADVDQRPGAVANAVVATDANAVTLAMVVELLARRLSHSHDLPGHHLEPGPGATR